MVWRELCNFVAYRDVLWAGCGRPRPRRAVAIDGQSVRKVLTDNELTIANTTAMLLTAADIKQRALAMGFDVCGIATAALVDERARRQYRQWLERGRQGCMAWAERYQAVRDDPRALLDGAQSLVMVGMNYLPQRLQPADAPQFAYYAYGRDYHDVLKKRLWQLAAEIQEATGCVSRACVDSAPLRERYWAQQAGLGFIGRNNQLIVPGRGSYFVLGALLTTLALEADAPCTLSCGDCGACLEACPTGALDGDGAVDARRCLSCLTIELRGPLPEQAQSALGHRVYGCDSCQRCCPHNSLAQATQHPEFEASDELMSLTLDDIVAMDRTAFNRLFRHSAVKRAKLEGLQRNANALRHPDEQ